MSDEQELLIRKSRRTLRSAQLCLDDGDFDTSASCSYYAMFYATSALLLGRGMVFSKHSAVIAAFGRDFAKSGIVDPMFHAWLRDAEQARQRGDYGAPSGITGEAASLHLRRAEQFVDQDGRTADSRASERDI